jgi:hypothetical protein
MMNTRHRSGCLVCGRELVYLESPAPGTCALCGTIQETDARCIDGHVVCDRCHALPAEELIMQFCSHTTGTDPLAMAITLMRNPAIAMHGPEHHFLVPAVLITAYYNAREMPELKAGKLRVASTRAGLVKGGFCGLLGDCGAAVGAGIFISIITGATPLSREEWQLTNLCTAEALREIAIHGGPRCCKRNLFLAVRSAVGFIRNHMDVTLPIAPEIRCEFFPLNTECRMTDCPFYPENAVGAGYGKERM